MGKGLKELVEELNKPIAKKSETPLVTKWVDTGENGARLMTMPNIPTPLQGEGMQPRTIFGVSAWNKIRKKCYADAGYHCQICGADCTGSIMHCLERGTEVLTNTGWKPVESVTIDDTVAQFDPTNNEVSWATPTSTTYHFEENIYRFKYKKGFSIGVSSGHRMLIMDGKTKQFNTVTAKNLKVNQWASIPAAGFGSGEGHLTVNERVKIAIQADGSLNRRNKNGEYIYLIRVKREDKKARLRKLLSETTLKMCENTCPSDMKRGYSGFFVWSDTECKKFNNSFSIDEFSGAKANEFLDELVKWDGWSGTRKGQPGRCYYTSDKDNIDFVQAVCAQAGVGSHLTMTYRKTRDWGKWHISQKKSTNLKSAYNLEIKSRNSYGLQTMTKVVEAYNDDVFCISVPTSYFVARTKGGDVFITGNCHEVYSIDYKKHTSTFERVVALCPLCHVKGIHSGRALTLYKKGVPYMSREKLLEGAENAFTIISSYNRAHPGAEPLRAFETFLDYAKQPALKAGMEHLIRKYNMEFYHIDERSWKRKYWSDWRIIINGVEYPTVYENIEAWQDAMEINNTNNRIEESKLSFNEEVNKFFDELEKNKH